MVNRGVTLAGISWAFTTFYNANWHPLTWIAHMIDSQLFGLNAGGHLLVNALIHVANTLLVFWFLLRATDARWPSALVAALFALHPLHVESVAWASERKDTLSAFFGLLSLIAYVRYAEAPSISRYAWTAITLALGLLAKPMLVTWPFVMLLLDYWPLRRLSQSTSWKNFLISIAPPPAREIAVVCSRDGVRSYDIRRAIPWRCCPHIYAFSYCAAAVERACVVREILIAHVLAA